MADINKEYIKTKENKFMQNNIKLITVFLLSVYITAGCSGQKNEMTKSLLQMQPVETDSTEQYSQNSQEKSNPKSPLVTFIELGSVKCIPCKMMQPIMDEIKKEYPDQVKVEFYDVWKEKGKPYAVKYSIRVIPTQIFLNKNGEEYFRHEGFFPKEELVEVLKKQGVK